MSKQQDRRNTLLNNGPFNQSGRLAESQRLLSQVGSSRGLSGAMVVPAALVTPNANQIRQIFDNESLQELAADIAQRGILEPLLVRLNSDQQHYEIIAGERRYRAALLAGLVELPIIVKELDDQEARFIMLVENIQRRELDKADERRFFEELQRSFNFSITDIANLIHKSRAYVHGRLQADVTNSEEMHNPSESDTLNISSQDEQNASVIAISNKEEVQKGKKSALKFNPNSFKRFYKTIDDIGSVLDQNPDNQLRELIREHVVEMESKLAVLKQKLLS